MTELEGYSLEVDRSDDSVYLNHACGWWMRTAAGLNLWDIVDQAQTNGHSCDGSAPWRTANPHDVVRSITLDGRP